MQKHFSNAEEAKIVVQEIEEIVERKVEAKKDVLATKEDLHVVKQDLLYVKTDLIDRIYKAKVETIIWIVSVGVLQFILSILAKKFL